MLFLCRLLRLPRRVPRSVGGRALWLLRLDTSVVLPRWQQLWLPVTRSSFAVVRSIAHYSPSSVIRLDGAPRLQWSSSGVRCEVIALPACRSPVAIAECAEGRVPELSAL